jgi:hypothetical protein
VGGACCTHGRREEGVQGFVVKPEGKRPLGRPRRRWEDWIRMDLREVGWGGGGMERLYRAWDRDWWRALVNSVMNLRVLVLRVS